MLHGPAQDDDITVEVFRKRRWLSEPRMTSNKASQETSEVESQDSPGPLEDAEADNSSQITVSSYGLLRSWTSTSAQESCNKTGLLKLFAPKDPLKL